MFTRFFIKFLHILGIAGDTPANVNTSQYATTMEMFGVMANFLTLTSYAEVAKDSPIDHKKVIKLLGQAGGGEYTKGQELNGSAEKLSSLEVSLSYRIADEETNDVSQKVEVLVGQDMIQTQVMFNLLTRAQVVVVKEFINNYVSKTQVEAAMAANPETPSGAVFHSTPWGEELNGDITAGAYLRGRAFCNTHGMNVYSIVSSKRAIALYQNDAFNNKDNIFVSENDGTLLFHRWYNTKLVEFDANSNGVIVNDDITIIAPQNAMAVQITEGITKKEIEFNKGTEVNTTRWILMGCKGVMRTQNAKMELTDGSLADVPMLAPIAYTIVHTD